MLIFTMLFMFPGPRIYRLHPLCMVWLKWIQWWGFSSGVFEENEIIPSLSLLPGPIYNSNKSVWDHWSVYLFEMIKMHFVFYIIGERLIVKLTLA